MKDNGLVTAVRKLDANTTTSQIKMWKVVGFVSGASLIVSVAAPYALKLFGLKP